MGEASPADTMEQRVEITRLAFWVLVGGATVVSLLPFLVLLSYVLRIATVAKRTQSIGPLTLREA